MRPEEASMIRNWQYLLEIIGAAIFGSLLTYGLILLMFSLEHI
jgi:hypothetical protein